MTFGVISDTHSLDIPSALLERFKSVDMIIHAGDITDADTLKGLKKLAPTKAVQGNMDEIGLKKELPVKEIITCNAVKIGVVHGHIGQSKDARANAQEAFKGQNLDIIIYGHSHVAYNEKIGQILLFNPGSPNDVVKADFFSYGLIHIIDGKVKAEIIKI